MASQISDPWVDIWTEAEAQRFWDGYEEFLTHIDTLDDDARTVVMEVGPF